MPDFNQDKVSLDSNFERRLLNVENILTLFYTQCDYF